MTRKITSPVVTAETKAFWDAAREGGFLIPICTACGKTHWYPRAICPFCASDKVEWREASGKGTALAGGPTRRRRSPRRGRGRAARRAGRSAGRRRVPGNRERPAGADVQTGLMRLHYCLNAREPIDAFWSVRQRHRPPRRTRCGFGPRLQAVHRLQHRGRSAGLSFDVPGRASFHRRRPGFREPFAADLAGGEDADTAARHGGTGAALAQSGPSRRAGGHHRPSIRRPPRLRRRQGLPAQRIRRLLRAD